MGGRDGSSCLRSVECFDPHTNKWSMCAPMSKRRGGVGVATYNNFLYAVGGHDAPASNHCSRLSDCVERWVSAWSREGRVARWDGLSVQSGESSSGRGRDPRVLLTPPPRPSVMSALSCREELPASQRGYFTVSGTICWPQSYPGTISEMRISSQNNDMFMLKHTMPVMNLLTTLKKHSDDLSFKLG